MSQTVINSAGTPFQLFAVATNADTVILVGDNDILIEHTGVQSDGTTASASTDYVTVMNAFTGDGTTASTMAASYAAGLKMNVPQGQGRAIRGFDASYGAALNAKQLIIRASGNGAMVQITKGSQFGSKQ